MRDEVIPPGTILGDRYRIEQQIGSGGMGRVYRATHLDLAREVALKVISPSDANSLIARRRFEREARVASALRHPNAVEIYDFGTHGTTMYLVMELLSGYSLRAIVDVDLPPIRPRRASQIAADVADVLASAAAIGMVHRDLKPENIMIDSSGDRERTVVLDFGLAYIDETEDLGRLTTEGIGIGTPDYLSPEQARGVQITPASDVYSLGCVMYEMLTSAPPFMGKQALLMSQHLFVPPASLRERAPDLDIPNALDELVLRMLAKSPADRPSALAVAEALRSLDPDAPQRAGGSPRLGRTARMVSKPPIQTGSPTEEPEEWSNVDISVATLGPLDQDLTIGLAANGIQAVPIGDADAEVPLGVRAVFAPDARPSEVEALTETGLPVLTDANASDIDRLAKMLRAGASEVVIRPCSPEETARKIWRAVRKG